MNTEQPRKTGRIHSESNGPTVGTNQNFGEEFAMPSRAMNRATAKAAAATALPAGERDASGRAPSECMSGRVLRTAPASSATRRSRYGITLAGMAMPFSL